MSASVATTSTIAAVLTTAARHAFLAPLRHTIRSFPRSSIRFHSTRGTPTRGTSPFCPFIPTGLQVEAEWNNLVLLRKLEAERLLAEKSRREEKEQAEARGEDSGENKAEGEEEGAAK